MRNIGNYRDEITQLWSYWAQVMEIWDDIKSHEINDGEYQSIRYRVNKLIESSEATQLAAQQISQRSYHV